MADTLCWDCRKAVCGCSWSRHFIPVNGWKAKKTKIKNGQQGYASSYKVIDCPEFIKDKPRQICANRKKRTIPVKDKCRAILENTRLTQRALAERLGLSASTICYVANGRFVTKPIADKIERMYDEIMKE